MLQTDYLSVTPIILFRKTERARPIRVNSCVGWVAKSTAKSFITVDQNKTDATNLYTSFRFGHQIGQYEFYTSVDRE